MNEKQQQLTFEKGITNVPSDAICSDNALEESIGMVYENGEHKVIQKPVAIDELIVNVSEDEENPEYIVSTLVFVHTSSQSTRYIVTYGGGIYLYDDETPQKLCDYTGELSVTAIGNTLVISHGGGIVYAKWSGSEYTVFFGLPDINFVPYMTTAQSSLTVTRIPLNRGINAYGVDANYLYVNNDGTYRETTVVEVGNNYNALKYTLTNVVDKRQTFQDLFVGEMAKFIDDCHKEGAFIFPFWVRMAIELYDGSITMHTAPILMCPSVRRSCAFTQCTEDSFGPEPSTQPYHNDWFCANTRAFFLNFLLSSNDRFTGYEDIIKGVKIYVSKEVHTQYINEDCWEFHNVIDNEKVLWDGVYSSQHAMVVATYRADDMDKLPTDGDSSTVKTFYKSYIYPAHKTDKEIMEELISNSVFYELCDISYEELLTHIETQGDDAGKLKSTVYEAEHLMAHHALFNLETQTQMPHDDYYSHTKMSNGKLFAYNSRINIYGAKRKAFEGFGMFLSESTNVERFRIFVHINTDAGMMVVKHDFYANFIIGYYFYYPDPRAMKADVYIRRTVNNEPAWLLLTTLALKEHPGLNGAYAFVRLPYDTGSVWNGPFAEHPSQFYPDNFYTSSGTVVPEGDMPTVNDEEDMPNTIITTEVDNPYVFYAEGSNKVGDGTIIGMATQTVALSNGTEFGSQPLIVFTDRGLWSMAVGKTGLYDYTKPLPREVCNNPNSITEVDGAVFFASDKGLMLIAGSDVKCVSEQLSGKASAPFAEFLSEASMAYDYRDSLLWIFNMTEAVCWVYNIKSGTFAHYDFVNTVISNVVADYPDYLLQSSDGTVYSLLKRPNINDDVITVNGQVTENTYSATMITRPLKLENAFALKSIMQIRHVLQFTPYTVTTTSENPETHETVTTETTQKGTMTLRIFASNNLASNNLDDWAELHSLRGTPWKYYRLRFDFSDMKATDRFAGTILITQERRTNKLR